MNEEHDVPGFGKLGQSPEEAERERIERTDFGANEQESWDTPEATKETIEKMAASRAAARARLAAAANATLAPIRAHQTRALSATDRQELSEIVGPMIGKAFGQLGEFLGDLKHDIKAQTDLMRAMDVPMEAIADSHERASASFETLRKDIFKGGTDKLEQILDVSGLADQASKAEKRMEALIARLEAKIDTQFAAHAKDMVAILHLFERLQARELRDAKARAKVKRK